MSIAQSISNLVAKPPAAAPSNILSAAQQTVLTSILNKARTTVTIPASGMRKLTYNPALQAAIDNFIATNQYGGDWFNIPGNKYTLMQQPGFEAFSDYSYLFHDTCGKGAQGIAPNFNFRAVRQKGCFAFQNCNTSTFNGYTSCFNPETTVKNCSWGYQYYPIMVTDGLSSFACASLGVTGVVNAHNQPNSYACYGLVLDKNGNPGTTTSNDQPYVAGTACSACPTDAPEASSGLCVPGTAAKTSILNMYNGQSNANTEDVAANISSDKIGITTTRQRPR